MIGLKRAARHAVVAAAGLGLPLGTATAHDSSLHAVADNETASASVVAEDSDPLAAFFALLVSSAEAAAGISISANGTTRVITANGIPDHGTGRFPNANNPNSIRAQSYTFRVPVNPRKGGTTQIRRYPMGIALNGVVFDPATAEYWNGDRRWNYEALAGNGPNLGLDRNNAHVQPNGAYHYHGIPTGLVSRLGTISGPVLIGYAADGFPIYGPFGYRDAKSASSGVKTLTSSYVLKSGTRPNGPGGRYDGTFTADWTYVAGRGDLDACNGRDGVTPEYPDGTYYYVITDSFPFVPRCLRGTPDRSFTAIANQRQGGPRQAGPRRNGPQGGPPPQAGQGQGRGPGFLRPFRRPPPPPRG